MIRMDMPRVLEIESTRRDPLDESELIAALRRRNCIGRVVEELAPYPIMSRGVVGYMLTETHKGFFSVSNLVVSPEYRRQGAGQQMILRLMASLSSGRRDRILVNCRESETEGHLFLKSQGFRAIRVDRFGYGDEDLYAFEYRLPGAWGTSVPVNRMSQYLSEVGEP